MAMVRDEAAQRLLAQLGRLAQKASLVDAGAVAVTALVAVPHARVTRRPIKSVTFVDQIAVARGTCARKLTIIFAVFGHGAARLDGRTVGILASAVIDTRIP